MLQPSGKALELSFNFLNINMRRPTLSLSACNVQVLSFLRQLFYKKKLSSLGKCIATYVQIHSTQDCAHTLAHRRYHDLGHSLSVSAWYSCT